MKMAVNPISVAVLSGMLTLAGPAMADTIKLRIIETTDIHTNVMDYDYYKDQPSQQIGLSRAATLVTGKIRSGKQRVGRQRRLNSR